MESALDETRTSAIGAKYARRDAFAPQEKASCVLASDLTQYRYPRDPIRADRQETGRKALNSLNISLISVCYERLHLWPAGSLCAARCLFATSDVSRLPGAQPLPAGPATHRLGSPEAPGRCRCPHTLSTALARVGRNSTADRHRIRRRCVGTSRASECRRAYAYVYACACCFSLW